MARCRVNVPRLNKRLFPVENFADVLNVVGVVYEGFEFESKGIHVNTLGRWHKDADGYYYWEGCLSVIGSPQAGLLPNGTPQPIPPGIAAPESLSGSWMTRLRITEIWKYATGKNIGVAVVDTGIADIGPELPVDKQQFCTFEPSNTADTFGHGTHCAGLIGARNLNGMFIGVAPGCRLFICKIANEGSIAPANAIRYAEAINWCANQKEIRVISISWGTDISDLNLLQQIQMAIDLAVSKGKIVVCAMGDAHKAGYFWKIYPVGLKNTIGIGTIPVTDTVYNFVNDSLVTCVEGDQIRSYGLDGKLVEMTGTSQATAIVAGIIALMLEKDPTLTADLVKRKLLDASLPATYLGETYPLLSGDLLFQLFT